MASSITSSILSSSQHASITWRGRGKSGKEGKKARNALYAAEDHVYHIFHFSVPPFTPGSFLLSSCMASAGGLDAVRYTNADNLLTKVCLVFGNTAKDPGSYRSGAPGWMVEAVPCCFLRCMLGQPDTGCSWCTGKTQPSAP